jgi:hypothetical protein
MYLVARTLKLDYGSLQKRLGGAPTRRRMHRGTDRDAEIRPKGRRHVGGDAATAPPAFMELVRSAGADAEEYVIEFETGAGPRMRVRLRGATPEWSSLLRAWREVLG